ncbi:MAG: hypothetical protein U1C74_11000 [Phenylobacterium sp.]|nr:hypothetical protein [Phenylobacterium sp.]
MSSDPASPNLPPRESVALIEPPSPGGWRMVVGGVAAACVLGVGLGFMARAASGTPPEPPAPQVVEPSATRPLLQIVVDDTPAPLGAPLQVLPPDMAHAAALNAAPYVMPPLEDPGQAGLPMERLVKAAVAAPVVIAATTDRLSRQGSKATAPKAKSQARAEGPARSAKARSGEAKVAATKPRPAKAKSETARAERKEKPVRLAKAETKAKVETRTKAETRTKTGREKAAKSAADRKKPTVLAASKPKPKAAPPRKASKPTEAARRPVPRDDGSRRVAQASGCAGGCDDRQMDARERQLQRAYAQAEAAGVPQQALRRQQARWREARAAAAREAPWAVEDVYLARISELHDLTRDARDPYRALD